MQMLLTAKDIGKRVLNCYARIPTPEHSPHRQQPKYHTHGLIITDNRSVDEIVFGHLSVYGYMDTRGLGGGERGSWHAATDFGVSIFLSINKLIITHAI